MDPSGPLNSLLALLLALVEKWSRPDRWHTFRAHRGRGLPSAEAMRQELEQIDQLVKQLRPDLLGHVHLPESVYVRRGRLYSAQEVPGLAQRMKELLGQLLTNPAAEPTPAPPTPKRRPKGKPPAEPLSDNERQVLDVIRASPDGILGRQIEKRTGISQGTLTKHIIPKLARIHGVRNRPNVGYYIPEARK
jgi:hypothetical protein